MRLLLFEHVLDMRFVCRVIPPNLSVSALFGLHELEAVVVECTTG